MDNYVEKILNLWKTPFSNLKINHEPYPNPEQFKRTAGLFSSGLHYYYILDMLTLKIEYVSEGTKNILGIDSNELTIESLIERLISEQKDMVAKKESVVVDFFYNFLYDKDVIFYKSVYFCKVRDMKGNSHTLLHQAMPLTLTDGCKPRQLLVVHTDVSHLFVKHKDSLNFININGGKSYFDVFYEDGIFYEDIKSQNDSFSDFTPREKELLKIISEGLSSEDIAEKLNISIHTLRTHRKNILKKSRYKNIHEVVSQFLIAEML